jgi:predicted nucleic acid-binding Zn ribbon protein
MKAEEPFFNKEQQREGKFILIWTWVFAIMFVLVVAFLILRKFFVNLELH